MYGGPSLPIKKNENKKIENMKKILFRKKTSTKQSWPMSTKSDKKNFYSKRKKHKIAMAHECQI